MSKYYKVDDVSRAIIELPNAENGYSDSYDKAEILNALESLPTIEVSEDCISEFRDYQIEWLTSHCDLELEPVLEDFIVRFLKDTAETFIKENAPSVVPTAEQSSKVGEWIKAALEAHIVPAEDVKNDVDNGWNLAINKALEIVDTVTNDVGDKVTLENE